MRETDLDLTWIASDPGMRRLTELEDTDGTGEDPMATFAAQLIIVIDECMAALLRNTRAGRGKSLREQGFTATADELRNWKAKPAR